MSDEYGTSESGPVQPLPIETPVPAPVPLGVPVKKRSKWPWVAGVLAILALLGACVGAFYLIGTAIEDTLSDPGLEAMVTPSYAYEGATFVGWSGEGRYAVIQSFYADNVPTVVVWDAQTQTTRYKDGYVVVGVESAGAQIWLEPAEKVAEGFDSFTDAIDHKPFELLAWRLDDDSEPTDAASAKWRAWPGPGDYTAYLEVDPLKGCMPAKLLINNNAGSGEGVKAALPESTRTYAPIGWSPSGEYFAIEELIDGVATGLLGELDREAETAPDRKVLVFSATTGELVAEAVLPKRVGRVPCAVWGLDDDLYWADVDDMETDLAGYTQTKMKSLSVAGVVTDVHVGDRMEGAYSVIALGSDEKGALFYTDDGRLWRVDSHGVQHSGNLDTGNTIYTESAVWDSRGGLLSARYSYEYMEDSDAEFVEVVVSSEYGGEEREVWRGPVITPPLDPML